MSAYHAECLRVNDRIFKVIQSVLGNAFLADIQDVLTDCEVNGQFSLVKDPVGEWQRERRGNVTGIWVDQCSVGDSGDSYEGRIWIKLKERLYLQADFSM